MSTVYLRFLPFYVQPVNPSQINSIFENLQFYSIEQLILLYSGRINQIEKSQFDIIWIIRVIFLVVNCKLFPKTPAFTSCYSSDWSMTRSFLRIKKLVCDIQGIFLEILKNCLFYALFSCSLKIKCTNPKKLLKQNKFEQDNFVIKLYWPYVRCSTQPSQHVKIWKSRMKLERNITSP